MNFPVELPDHILALAREIGVKPEDIEEHFVRGTGHGGQKINKTSNCVELHHRPTNTNVRIQEYRQRSLNRLAAYKHLIYKVEQLVRGKASKKAREQYKIKKQKQRRSRRSQEKILQEKHHHSQIKNLRKDVF